MCVWGVHTGCGSCLAAKQLPTCPQVRSMPAGRRLNQHSRLQPAVLPWIPQQLQVLVLATSPGRQWEVVASQPLWRLGHWRMRSNHQQQQQQQQQQLTVQQ
jgi:hypothetical protein